MRTIHAGHVWYAELYKRLMRLKCKPLVYIYNIAVANVLKVLYYLDIQVKRVKSMTQTAF